MKEAPPRYSVRVPGGLNRIALNLVFHELVLQSLMEPRPSHMWWVWRLLYSTIPIRFRRKVVYMIIKAIQRDRAYPVCKFLKGVYLVRRTGLIYFSLPYE